MNDNSSLKKVVAQYNFAPSHNDELQFTKGDVIVVTQQIDGGWWEGTLGSKAGWFPSNYVVPICEDKVEAPELNESVSGFYRDMVLQSIIATEKAYLNDLSSFLQNYLKPSRIIIADSVFAIIDCTMDEILTFHKSLLNNLLRVSRLSEASQRIGKTFLEASNEITKLYKTYGKFHPMAVEIIKKQREKLEKFFQDKEKSINSSNFSYMASNIFRPFVRLEQYPNLLKELERHTPISHADLGDTQRSIEVYREIFTVCSDIRREKETEVNILHSEILGWDGEPISSFGDIVLLDNVNITCEKEIQDRILVLFPRVLLVLSVSDRLSGYVFEKKYPVNWLRVEQFYGDKLSLVLNNQKITYKSEIQCNKWFDAIVNQRNLTQCISNGQNITELKITTLPNSFLNAQHSEICESQQTAKGIVAKQIYSAWSSGCLKPNPPNLNNHHTVDFIKSPKSARKEPTKFLAGSAKDAQDALVLNVIEAYYKASKRNSTTKSRKYSTICVFLTKGKQTNKQIQAKKNIF
ncbi:DgyrCDS3000 [Dimorphilus gyrociliatus]|uniref:DgyrCDS3000 n=2 Tax=Dimorphilus gyrociliatus TaxID=2664684 RepID=A0A7I8VCG7_9ANNE|nr:DgyrCDS3000 [Dimorphilus gyrociliatus]